MEFTIELHLNKMPRLRTYWIERPQTLIEDPARSTAGASPGSYVPLS
jgi:hypothetical protein